MSVFQFKQFKVAQDRCGMKISSVACVFAALIAPKPFSNLLDIGAGTGVLSLMIAQKNAANITAIELEAEAAQQATENFEMSKWNSRLMLLQENVIKWAAEQTAPHYDCIVCNPPFFKGQANSSDFQRNLARHSQTLDATALAKISEKMLFSDGQAHFLIANGYEKQYTLAFEAQGFHLIESVQIFAHPFKQTPFCYILSFSKIPQNLLMSRFDMQDEHFQMHPYYKELMKDYLIIFAD